MSRCGWRFLNCVVASHGDLLLRELRVEDHARDADHVHRLVDDRADDDAMVRLALVDLQRPAPRRGPTCAPCASAIVDIFTASASLQSAFTSPPFGSNIRPWYLSW